MAKEFKPNVTLNGGASGEHVRSLKGPANSYVRGGGDRVFETDAQGKVIRDIAPQRVKLRKQHKNPAGEVFEEMEKVPGSVSAADLEILRKMGVLK
jgi:hypothetical protein